MNWYKKAQGYIPTMPYTYPYYLEEVIKMQEDGLALSAMSPEELKHAKELEQNGAIKKVIKQDKKGKFLAYVTI